VILLRSLMALTLLAAVAAGGWVSAVAPTPPPLARSSDGLELPLIGKPALAYGDVASLFREILPVAGPVGTEPVIAEAPPQQDIVQVFRAEWTATTGRGRRALVWVIDPQAENGRRSMPIGAEYQQGWIIAEARGGTVVLRKDGETREVRMFEQAIQPP